LFEEQTLLAGQMPSQLDQTLSSFDNPSNTSTAEVKQNRAEPEQFRASPVGTRFNHHAAAQKRRKLALQ
jgi:hypothetical protein